MAPSTIPSPHRFLSTSGKQPAPPNDQRTTTALPSNSPKQNPGTNFNTQSTQASNYGASQFAAKPRFAGSRTPLTQQSAIRSPKTRKDRVEEFDDESVISGYEKAYSPLLDTVKRPRGREWIDESFGDHEGHELMNGSTYGLESQFLVPLTRKRKLPLPPSWPTTGNQEDEYQVLSPRHAPDIRSPFTQSKIDRLSPTSPLPVTTSENQFLVSPRLPFSTSPSSTGRSAPRFDFTKLTERTASKLQKVTGTGQFIFDSLSAGNGHNEPPTLDNANLTLLFSPQKHRKYQYAPGGLATTVRDWVLDAAAGINNATTLMTFRVLTVEAGERGSRMVYGVNKLQERERYLLFGEPRGSRDTIITKGSVVTIMDPSWKLELEEVWTVVVNWKVSESGNI